ncbi:CPBP family intramembrane metalloprotease (plasmid) [Clostridium estertheticum]|nr:CPBP family intramembrane metalloprotease [Clostridium estertheticum]WLC86574.1 CPBP family intramembrane metalloprotease [Clostridium estertheticum]
MAIYLQKGKVIKITNEKNIFIISLLIYIFIFIIPTVLYLKLKDKLNPFQFLKLNKNVKKSFTKGFTISILFIVGLIIKNFFLGWVTINLNIGILWINGLIVGMLEEIPFRGFILQKLMKNMGFIKANIVTTMLFALVHVPDWIFSNSNILSSLKSVLILGFILGYLFKESDSLWVPIICHSVFNISIWIGLG